jgi:phosphatidate phosphatase APP1
LIGDTSQQDPEIYHEIARRYGSRILAIYIRNVNAHPERSAAIQTLADDVLAAGSSLLLADDTAAAARHAAEQGWITRDSVREVEMATSEDEDRPDAPEAPTVVVE